MSIRNEPTNVVHAQLQAISPALDVEITRQDRHDITSLALVAVVKVDSGYGPLTFMQLTQIAGLFETPNIEIEAEPDGDPLDFLGAHVTLRVSW